MKGLTFLKYIFVILGLVMFVGTFFSYKSTSEFLSSSIETEGTVIEIIATNSTGSDSSSRSKLLYTPVFEFSDSNGILVEFPSSVSSHSSSYFSVGEKKVILYNPESPNEITIKGSSTIWGGTIILGIFGVIFFSIGVVILIVLKKLIDC